MTTIDRRRFLTGAVLGTAIVGATAFGAVDAPAAFAAEPVLLDPATRDPNFAEGRVAGINGTMLMVTGSDLVLHRIQVTGASSIWKLNPTTFDSIAVGDGLYARGAMLADGTLAADAVWVNIVNIRGTVRAMARNRLDLDHNGSPVICHVVPGLSAAVYNHTPAVSDLSQITVGQYAQVLGAWRPDTNEVDIATVYTHV